MKKLLTFILSLTAAGFVASAQQVDSLALVPADSIVVVNVFSSLPFNVNVKQTRSLKEAVNLKAGRNASKLQHGYRIRLFFDNRQSAREQSYEAYCSFVSLYPDTPAYRVFDAPFFKVTVGDFRTKAEALAFMKEISGRFPSAFVVREDFRFPSLDAPVRKEASQTEENLFLSND